MSGDIVPLHELAEEAIGPLLAASEREGYRFVRRLVTEWASGANRFSGTGEVLLGCLVEGRLAGLCGLVRDPYRDQDGVGRLRHLYVLPEHRGHGIGTALTTRVVELAKGSFQVLRLRTDTARAAALYERLGFRKESGDPSCTHVLP